MSLIVIVNVQSVVNDAVSVAWRETELTPFANELPLAPPDTVVTVEAQLSAVVAL